MVLIVRIGFGNSYAGFHGIQRAALFAQYFPGAFICRLPEIPGGNHDGFIYDGWIRVGMGNWSFITRPVEASMEDCKNFRLLNMI